MTVIEGLVETLIVKISAQFAIANIWQKHNGGFRSNAQNRQKIDCFPLFKQVVHFFDVGFRGSYEPD